MIFEHGATLVSKSNQPIKSNELSWNKNDIIHKGVGNLTKIPTCEKQNK